MLLQVVLPALLALPLLSGSNSSSSTPHPSLVGPPCPGYAVGPNKPCPHTTQHPHTSSVLLQQRQLVSCLPVVVCGGQAAGRGLMHMWLMGECCLGLGVRFGSPNLRFGYQI